MISNHKKAIINNLGMGFDKTKKTINILPYFNGLGLFKNRWVVCEISNFNLIKSTGRIFMGKILNLHIKPTHIKNTRFSDVFIHIFKFSIFNNAEFSLWHI
jgi:hypothetical protein